MATLSAPTYSLFVGHSFRQEKLIECFFLHARGLSHLDGGCADDLLAWLVPLLGATGFNGAAALKVVGSVFQLATLGAFILAIEDPWQSNKTFLFMMLYFPNPVTMLSGEAYSALVVPSVLHLLIAVLLCSAARGWRVPAVLAMVLLVASNGAFVCAAPALLGCFRGEARGTPPLWTSALAAVTVLVCSAALHAVVIGGGGGGGEPVYRPSSGVFWYLEMEVFPRYRSYFALLVAAPPYVLAVPAALRLRARPLHALSLMLMLVMYFRRDTSFADIIFILAAMAAMHTETVFNDTYTKSLDLDHFQEPQELPPLQQRMSSSAPASAADGAVAAMGDNDDAAGAADTSDPAAVPTDIETSQATNTPTPTVGMRFLPLIALGIAVPMAVSEPMLELWTGNGTGNANFLFFQGLIMWVFLATGIIEFTNATTREIND